jgi:hypothetical protein
MIIKIDMEIPLIGSDITFFLHSLPNLVFTPFSYWIEACINNPWIAPLLNGHPTIFFKATRGLKKVFHCPLFSTFSWQRHLGRRLDHE